MDTIGSLIDKLSINELKIYHVRERMQNVDIGREELQDCKQRLRILNIQKEDLKEELQQLLDSIVNGNTRMKVFRQLKMYKEKR